MGAAVRSKQALKRSNFRTIEMELYNYRETKQDVAVGLAADLKELEEAAYYSRQISATASKGGEEDPNIDPSFIRPQGGYSDPTLFKTEHVMSVRRRMIRQYQETLRRLEAIEWMLQCLESDPEPGKLRLIEMKYFNHAGSNDILMEKLGVSRATFYRWQREAIRLVAYRLGWTI